MTRKTVRTAIAALATAIVATAATGTAYAATAPSPYTAVTHVTHRADGGGGGTWAYDTFTRTIYLTDEGPAAPSHCGGHLPCEHFSYTLKDGANGGARGGFTTIQGAPAPNQGPGHAGDTITASDFGAFSGQQAGDFYTDALTSPAARNVPKNVSGNGTSSSNWPTLEWPAGTPAGDFFGLGATSFGYRYQVTINHQVWIDATGSDGQAPADGQITR